MFRISSTENAVTSITINGQTYSFKDTKSRQLIEAVQTLLGDGVDGSVVASDTEPDGDGVKIWINTNELVAAEGEEYYNKVQTDALLNGIRAQIGNSSSISIDDSNIGETKTWSSQKISQELQSIGELSNLQTTDKSNIVNAINEVARNGGTGGSGVAGADGREIELQKSTTHIQWRYVGDSTWNNLIAIAELKGEKGDTGQAGQDAQILWHELTVSGGNLTLTTDKYQYCTDVSTLAEVILPTVSDMSEVVELHLFINPTTDITAILPSCSWQNGSAPTIVANKIYELIFTYCNSWTGGVVVYE